MPKKVPKKNIKPIVLDIRNPKFNYDHLTKLPVLNIPDTSLPGVQKWRKVRKISLYVLSFILVGFLSLTFLGWINFKEIKISLEKDIPQVLKNFNASADSIKNLETEKAVEHLSENKKVLASFNENLDGKVKQELFEVLGNFFPFVNQGMTVFKQISALNVKLLYLSETLHNLKINGLYYLFEDGQSLINKLEEIKSQIKEINELAKEIKNNTSNLKNLIPSFSGDLTFHIENNYLKYSTVLYGWDNVLENLINILKSEKPQHIVVFFQNPAEIRPAGGFLGSYAHIILDGGQIKNIDVRDIYDPDGQLDIKIVPPLELQGITENWGARDANWFFDFPTSAKTVLNFLNSSKMYFEKGVKFENAIALNINVVSSLLEIVGPIKVKDYPEVNKENILYVIQNETEGGKDKLKGEPKRILKVITPIIIERLKDLSSSQKEKLFALLENHLDKKDIMFYSQNKVLQNFYYSEGIDGGVYKLPDDFWGSYLAVVNTNIAGGKSDAFVKENVSVNVDLDTEGNVFTTLEVERTHLGNNMKESWWRANNNNYIQIFTEPHATLVDITGHDLKKKSKETNYANLDYAINPDLDNIEKNKKFISNFNVWQGEQFGKNVFGAWFIVKAGESKKLKVRYTTNYSTKKILLPGDKYTFIFEKQSGVDNSLRVKINAPFKYYWQESNSPLYVYESNDISKRTIITLTLGYNKPKE